MEFSERDKGGYSKGFTLLELLVVMSIIGIMASFGVITYPGVQRSARDAQRRSDLKQYHTALEGFANTKGGFYPSRISQTPASDQEGTTPNLCEDLSMSGCPADPKTNQNICAAGLCNYYYFSNGTTGTATATAFVLYARLEKKVNNQDVFYVICGSGSSGTTPSTWAPSSTCPL